MGQACLIFCVLTDKVFGEAVCSKFPFQLPSHQCQLPHSDPMNHWFVCVIKTPVTMPGTKHPQLHLVTQPGEENVLLRACPTTVTEGCFYRDLSFTDGSTDVTVTASDMPVL